jgi:aminoglycoside/choline kinase family phosphotransferase
MATITEQISQLVQAHFHQQPNRIAQLPPSGSNRTYYRVYLPHQTVIATYNNNVRENETFVRFSAHFKQLQLPVPAVWAMNEEHTIYLQEDLGDTSLLNVLETQGFTPEVFAWFQQSLTMLARLQIMGHRQFPYDACLTAKEFGKQAIMSDLLYFKYYFLDTLQTPYDKQALMDDFEALSTYLTKTEHRYFLFRDFQSRNIFIHNGTTFAIDFQGGMKGALQYDVASLLWQARANLSEQWKQDLLTHYMDEVDKLLPRPLNRTVFVGQYNGYVLIRLLQVLGAYGFRGLFERKAHFLASIPLALQNLQYFMQDRQVGIITPELDRLLRLMTDAPIMQRFYIPKADENTPLRVEINSFSYREGIPADTTGNGGGFVFDMRGILNPGRINAYKHLSGLDKPVQDFLEQETQMNVFLNSVWDVIDITIQEYMRRGFEHLQINFGCTGGQHRSVYAAEQTARHLRNKYRLKVQLTHTNRANWVTLPVTEEKK